jgi:hypothetical protein
MEFVQGSGLQKMCLVQAIFFKKGREPVLKKTWKKQKDCKPSEMGI